LGWPGKRQTPKEVVAACNNVEAVGDEFNHWLGPYVVQRQEMPSYTGPDWQRLIDRLSQLLQSARETNDPSFFENASKLSSHWGSLSGSEPKYNPQTPFTTGLEALGNLYDWCEEKGRSIDLPESGLAWDSKKLCYDAELLADQVNPATVDHRITKKEYDTINYRSFVLRLWVPTDAEENSRQRR
jgi:hypothetical protein